MNYDTETLVEWHARMSERAPAPVPADAAERIWPDSTYLQAEWRRAVAVVRESSRGWLLDKPLQRVGHVSGLAK